MRNIESLRSLQKRIREAKGADRELDAEIAKAFGMPHGYHEWIEDRTYYDTFEQAAPYTSDPDGLGPCVALMRAALPGCEWSRDSAWFFWIWEPISKNAWGAKKKKRIDGGPYHLANDCLTFLDAIFSAAIAQEEAKEKAGA